MRKKEIMMLANRKRAAHPGGVSPNVLVEDVADEIQPARVARAKTRGRSLQDYVISPLREITDRPTMRKITELIEASVRDDPSVAISPEEFVAIVCAGRDERDDTIL